MSTSKEKDWSSANNIRPLRPGEYRVWAYGESRICNEIELARAWARDATRWCHSPQIIDHRGDQI